MKDIQNTYGDVLCWKLDIHNVIEGEKVGGSHIVFYIRKRSFTMLCVEEWVHDDKVEFATEYNDYGDAPFFDPRKHLRECLNFPKFPKECKDEVRKFKTDSQWSWSKPPVITQEVKFPDDETMEIKITKEDMVVWQKWKKGKPWWVEYRYEEYDEEGKPVPYTKVEARLVEEESTSKDDSGKDDGKDEKDSAKDSDKRDDGSSDDDGADSEENPPPSDPNK